MAEFILIVYDYGKMFDCILTRMSLEDMVDCALTMYE